VEYLNKFFLVAIVCFAFLLNIPFLAQASPLAYTTDRISGQDRVETALSIAQKGWTSAQTVILSEYTDYPGSIAAVPFAASLDAPILLTRGDKLDPRVITELQRLNPQKVFLLGGEAGLTSTIETGLESLSLSWERIDGANRYETSVRLAEQLSSDSLIIVNGDDFPDALSAASYAGIKRIPIVLTSKTIPPSVAEYTKKTQPQHVIVIGGEGVVPTEALTKEGINIETRLGGQNRYETNAQVVEYMKDAVESDDLFLASGMDFPDAVAGAGLAAKLKASLLLTEKEDIPAAVYTIMREHMKVEPSTATTESGQGKITASGGLNLRDTPSASGKLQLTIPEGTTVVITASQGQWYKTAYQNRSGWVSANYVTIIETYKQGRITASGGLNLRETSSTTADILMTIPRGATVRITGDQSDWYKITYRGTDGWVHADYVTILAGDGSPGSIDLSPNGKVYILGGTGVISDNTQNIIEGHADSKYSDNLKDFPSLPFSLTEPDSSYDEILIDPFEGISTGVLKGKKILIDPGHGGPDSGAIGQTYTFEKDVNLSIALYLNNMLAEAGATVSMTRKTDVCVASKYTERADLEARVAMANNTKPDLFISIHNNANSNPDNNGTSTYYSGQNPQATESAKMANAIQSLITGTVNTNNEGVRKADFYVLRNTNMPSVLIEAAYLSNPDEEERLQNPIFQKNMATAIFRGIIEYL